MWAPPRASRRRTVAVHEPICSSKTLVNKTKFNRLNSSLRKPTSQTPHNTQRPSSLRKPTSQHHTTPRDPAVYGSPQVSTTRHPETQQSTEAHKSNTTRHPETQQSTEAHKSYTARHPETQQSTEAHKSNTARHPETHDTQRPSSLRKPTRQAPHDTQRPSSLRKPTSLRKPLKWHATVTINRAPTINQNITFHLPKYNSNMFCVLKVITDKLTLLCLTMYSAIFLQSLLWDLWKVT